MYEMRITDYPQMMLAYLDPGAGSLILQLLAGGLAGLAVMGKLYWAEIFRVPTWLWEWNERVG